MRAQQRRKAPGPRAPQRTLVVGVLALQGDFAEHTRMLREAAQHGVPAQLTANTNVMDVPMLVRSPGARGAGPAPREKITSPSLGRGQGGGDPLTLLVREVRLPRDLEGLDGLIIPGGESTTIGKLLASYKLDEPIRQAAREGLPIWGTCAGMILMARTVLGGRGQPEGGLGLMDLVVRRNAFGRQLESFEADLDVAGFDTSLHAVFIRAPVIEEIGSAAEPVARLPDGRVVAARQGRLLATAFHPELTDDCRLHAWFLGEVAARIRSAGASAEGRYPEGGFAGESHP